MGVWRREGFHGCGEMVNPVARDIETKKPGINNGIRFRHGKYSGRVFLRSSVSAKF